MSNSILFGNNSLDLNIKTNSRGFDITISGTNKEFVEVNLITKVQDEEQIYTSTAKIINNGIHRVLFPIEIYQKEAIIVYQFKITVGVKKVYSQLFKRRIVPSQVNEFDDIGEKNLEKLEFHINDFESDYISNIEKYIKENVNIEEVIKGETATHSRNGFMSFQDKIKLDKLKQITGEEFIKKDTLENDLKDYAKKTDIPPAPNLSNYATKDEIPPTPDLSDYARLKDIPVVPDLSNYAKKMEIPTKIDMIVNQNDGSIIKLWLGKNKDHEKIIVADPNTVYFVLEEE